MHHDLQVRILKHGNRHSSEQAAPDEEDRAVEPSQRPLALAVEGIDGFQPLVKLSDLLNHLLMLQLFLFLPFP